MELDRRSFALGEVLEEVMWAADGSLLFVVTGRVAVYAGELVDSTRMLVRPAGR